MRFVLLIWNRKVIQGAASPASDMAMVDKGAAFVRVGLGSMGTGLDWTGVQAHATLQGEKMLLSYQFGMEGPIRLAALFNGHWKFGNRMKSCSTGPGFPWKKVPRKWQKDPTPEKNSMCGRAADWAWGPYNYNVSDGGARELADRGAPGENQLMDCG